jgi:hypothetical protein
MVSFITLHRGASIAAAELVAVSTNPDLVAYVAGARLRERLAPPLRDPAATALTRGRRRALRLIHAEASSSATRLPVPSLEEEPARDRGPLTNKGTTPNSGHDLLPLIPDNTTPGDHHD